MRAVKRLLRARLAVVLLGGLALAGCDLYRRLVDPGPPDVFVITIDTLRADAISPYLPGRLTPYLERLASESEVFERAITPMPITRPAQFAIFTGLYPREHGVVNNATAMPEDQLMLAEVMQRSGYATSAFVSVRHLDRGSGARQGFDTFEGTGRNHQRRGEAAVQKAVEYLNDAPKDRPIFMWLHTFDPHQPYDPPARFRDRVDPELGAKYPSLGWPVLDRIAGGNEGVIPGEILDHARALYYSEMEYGDELLGRFLAAIRGNRDFDDALIILTSDHGECFENGIYFEHSDCLLEGALRVPLLVRWPQQRVVGRSDLLVSHVDIAPTILAEVGIPDPPPSSGSPIQELGRAPRRVLLQQPYFDARKDYRARVIRVVGGDPVTPPVFERDRVGITNSEWKYVRTSGGGEETVHELYAMRPRPDERTNLAEQEPELVARLSRELDEELAAHPFRMLETQKIDDELRETLEALGYLRDED